MEDQNSVSDKPTVPVSGQHYATVAPSCGNRGSQACNGKPIMPVRNPFKYYPTIPLCQVEQVDLKDQEIHNTIFTVGLQQWAKNKKTISNQQEK